LWSKAISRFREIITGRWQLEFARISGKEGLSALIVTAVSFAFARGKTIDMDTTTFLNYTLSFTITVSIFWAFALWTGSPSTFNAIFGRDSTPLEASGYKYAASGMLAIAMGCISALFRSDLRKREALRIGTFIWLTDLITMHSQRDIYNDMAYYILTGYFLIGLIASFIGGFVLKLKPQPEETLKPQIVEVPQIDNVGDIPKHHQA
jgi:hypothetical protein